MRLILSGPERTAPHNGTPFQCYNSCYLHLGQCHWNLIQQKQFQMFLICFSVLPITYKILRNVIGNINKASGISLVIQKFFFYHNIDVFAPNIVNATKEPNLSLFLRLSEPFILYYLEMKHQSQMSIYDHCRKLKQHCILIIHQTKGITPNSLINSPHYVT